MRKFSGSGTCCACEITCDLRCGCNLNQAGFGQTSLPDQMVLSNLILPTGNSITSRTGECVVCIPPAEEEGQPYEWYPYTTYSQHGYQSLPDIIGTRIPSSESEAFSYLSDSANYCVWAADVNIDVGSNWDSCWDNNSDGGVAPQTAAAGSYEAQAVATSWRNSLPDQANRVYDPWSANGSGIYEQSRFAGLRRVEWIHGLSTDPFAVTVKFFAKQLWIPYVSKAFDDYTQLHNPHQDGSSWCDHCGGYEGSSANSTLTWWDESSIEKLNWDDPLNDSARIAAGDLTMSLEVPYVSVPTYTNTVTDFNWPELGSDADTLWEFTKTTCFDEWDGVDACSASGCTDRSDQWNQKARGTLSMQYNAVCLETAEGSGIGDCWSNNAGGGCMPFAKQGLPADAPPVTGFSFTLNGVTWTPTESARWFQNTISFNIESDDASPDRLCTLSSGVTVIGRTMLMSTNEPFQFADEYLLELDRCDGLVTGLCTAEPTMICTFTFTAGEECDECNPDPPAYGCCILADGTTAIAAGQAQCEGPMGGTYSGDGVECPPVGCCALVGSPDLSDVTEAHCTAQSGTWTEATACSDTGYCQDPVTGTVTSGVEENDCTGTWSSTPFPTGCCAILGATDQPDKNQVECTVLGGVWTEGAACSGFGWCVNDTTGDITDNIEEDECTGTWSATEPTSGCCTIGGTQNPDVAESWCTAQSGTFVAGACTAPPWDPTTSARIVVNSLTLDAPDPNFDCSENFYYYMPTAVTGAYTTDGVKSASPSGEVYGDSFTGGQGGTAVHVATTVEVLFNNSSQYQVTFKLIWQSGGNDFYIESTTNLASTTGLACPSFTLSGTFDNVSSIGGAYTTWSQSCNTIAAADLIGSYNITVECE